MPSESRIGMRVALRSFSSPVSIAFLQRKCACGQQTSARSTCEECRKQSGANLQRAALGPDAVETVPPIVHEVLRSPGQPLDPAARTFMESRFGHDFSRVRVHTDAKAVESAQAVQSLAYTVGRDVVFGVGQYAPATSAGKRLLAHELTHVVQQRSGLRTAVDTPAVGYGAHEGFEQEADRMAGEVVQGGSASVQLHPPAAMIQRQAVPTGIKLAEAKPFGHGDLKTDELKKKYRTYIGSTTQIGRAHV